MTTQDGGQHFPTIAGVALVAHAELSAELVRKQTLTVRFGLEPNRDRNKTLPIAECRSASIRLWFRRETFFLCRLLFLIFSSLFCSLVTDFTAFI